MRGPSRATWTLTPRAAADAATESAALGAAGAEHALDGAHGASGLFAVTVEAAARAVPVELAAGAQAAREYADRAVATRGVGQTIDGFWAVLGHAVGAAERPCAACPAG